MIRWRSARGLLVKLAEVEAPAAGNGDRKDEPGAAVTRAIMERASVGREARLWYGGLSRDRSQRAIAHVITKDEVGADIWLNGVAARQGAARVRTCPDNTRRARKLLALERGVRVAKLGLWSEDYLQVRARDDLGDAPYFAIVAGVILGAGRATGRWRRGSDGRRDQAGCGRAVGRCGCRRACRREGVRAGRSVALPVETGGAPLIRVTHWAQVEVV